MACQSWWTRCPRSLQWQAQVPTRSNAELLHLGCACQPVHSIPKAWSFKSSFLLSPSVREAKQEGVWDYPSSECSRWSKALGSCCRPHGRGRRERGRHGPSEGAAPDQYTTGASRDSCPLHFAELRQKDAGDLETVYFCHNETGNSTQGYKYILGFR